MVCTLSQNKARPQTDYWRSLAVGVKIECPCMVSLLIVKVLFICVLFIVEFIFRIYCLCARVRAPSCACRDQERTSVLSCTTLCVSF